jgi:signal transduction histidine kinase
MTGDSDSLPRLAWFEDTVGSPSAQLLMVQETERRRIARELHDDFTQRLVSLARDLRALAVEEPHDRSSRFLALADIANEIAHDLSRMARNLHPIILQDLGLSAALESECERFFDYCGVPVQHEIAPCPPEIPPLVALSLFRVAQESFRNIAKHSRARMVRLRLAVRDGELLLSIRDNGVGFQVERPIGEGRLGLTSMRERMRLVNGHLMIESRPGNGTTVTAIAPVPRAASADASAALQGIADRTGPRA